MLPYVTPNPVGIQSIRKFKDAFGTKAFDTCENHDDFCVGPLVMLLKTARSGFDFCIFISDILRLFSGNNIRDELKLHESFHIEEILEASHIHGV